LIRDLINFEIPYTSVIFAGVEPLGAHIYIDDGNVRCNDVIGFAAVGIGARHAESQFMLARHAYNSPLVDTALLTYIAKKRSEIAPGGGEATDMFTAGPQLGSLVLLQPELIAGFDQNLKSKEEQSHDDARKEANDLAARIASEAAALAPARVGASPGSPSAS
jgi:hypothetical protein